MSKTKHGQKEKIAMSAKSPPGGHAW